MSSLWYQLSGAGVRLHAQAGLFWTSRSEQLESLPQLLSDEGHEGGEQSQRHGHTVVEDTANDLPWFATFGVNLSDQHRLHRLLPQTEKKTVQSLTECLKLHVISLPLTLNTKKQSNDLLFFMMLLTT